jgi:hypothetical protein
MKKHEIERLLKFHMEGAGWSLETIEGLDRAFVRPQEVTPYFLPQVGRRPKDFFVIDGYVGIVHRDFERKWRETHDSSKNVFCFLSHTVNFRELTDSSYISSSSADTDVSSFCKSLFCLLDRFPQDERSLKFAFADREFDGFKPDDFKNIGAGQSKFDDFRLFAAALAD